jgi:hypothetical protein
LGRGLGGGEYGESFSNGVYEFVVDARRRRGSTGTADRDATVREEARQRERLEKSYGQVIEEEARKQRRKTIQQAADEFLADYKLKHESGTFAEYALGHVTNHLGKRLVVEITPTVVKRYQTDRLAEKAGPKTINDEVLLLLRLCGDQGDLIRARLRREKAMKLPTPPSPGRAYSSDEKARMLAEAAKLRSKNMYQRVTIRPDAVYAGHMVLLPGNPPKRVCPWNPDWDVKQARQYWKGHICGLLAGALAETLHTRCWQQQPASDERTDESKALEIADYFDPPTRAIQWVNQLRFQTLETLRAPCVWAAVGMVAQELVRAKDLDGAGVRALVQRTMESSTRAS